MQFRYFVRDEELLGRGLELNDILQNLLAKHDAIASGSPLPNQVTNVSPQRTETSASSLKQSEVRDSSPRDLSPRPNPIPSPPASTMTRSQIDEDEEEEDEFAQLARRLITANPFLSFTLSPYYKKSVQDACIVLCACWKFFQVQLLSLLPISWCLPRCIRVYTIMKSVSITFLGVLIFLSLLFNIVHFHPHQSTDNSLVYAFQSLN